MPESLHQYWQRVAQGLEQHIAANRNLHVEQLLVHLLAFMAHTVEDLEGRTTRNGDLLGTLDALPLLAFDSIRTALEAQRVLSIAGAATMARLCFEACCTMLFIARDDAQAAAYAKRYSRWKHVESLEFCRKTNQPLSWEKLIHHAEQAAEWLEPDTFRVRKGAHWANDPRYADLFKIANLLGMEDGYRKVYGAGSTFVHATSTASRLYRVEGKLRHVAEAQHVGRLSCVAAHAALKLHRAFLEFFGIPYDADDLLGVMAMVLKATQDVES